MNPRSSGYEPDEDNRTPPPRFGSWRRVITVCLSATHPARPPRRTPPRNRTSQGRFWRPACAQHSRLVGGGQGEPPTGSTPGLDPVPERAMRVDTRKGTAYPSPLPDGCQDGDFRSPIRTLTRGEPATVSAVRLPVNSRGDSDHQPFRKEGKVLRPRLCPPLGLPWAPQGARGQRERARTLLRT